MVGPLRNPLRSPAVRTFSTASPLRAAGSTASVIPVPPPLSRLETQQDMQQAREWIAGFEKVRTDAWPKSVVETSFARSSGAGGQHVNRTMSKAIIRFPLPSAHFIPPYCVPHLRQSPHFAASPPSLLISASTHRTQHTNLAECLDKLKAVILDAARRDLVGDTTAEQKNRVKGLVAKERAKMERVKKHRKDVKGGRGKVSF
ncbi:hypothetical protein RHOSPDRAFT_20037 [Rhodotorula sp. JG-1b]|nr:hypothetical protein RHOSPDRAFT_20037 [Rhodotorula sp. JG-1b]